jgi:hypothetical protein
MHSLSFQAQFSLSAVLSPYGLVLSPGTVTVRPPRARARFHAFTRSLAAVAAA